MGYWALHPMAGDKQLDALMKIRDALKRQQEEMSSKSLLEPLVRTKLAEDGETRIELNGNDEEYVSFNLKEYMMSLLTAMDENQFYEFFLDSFEKEIVNDEKYGESYFYMFVFTLIKYNIKVPKDHQESLYQRFKNTDGSNDEIGYDEKEKTKHCPYYYMLLVANNWNTIFNGHDNVKPKAYKKLMDELRTPDSFTATFLEPKKYRKYMLNEEWKIA